MRPGTNSLRERATVITGAGFTVTVTVSARLSHPDTLAGLIYKFRKISCDVPGV